MSRQLRASEETRRGPVGGPRWIRHRPDAGQRRATLALAAGVGAVVGAAVLYLSRLVVAREPITPAPRSPSPSAPRAPGPAVPGSGRWGGSA